MFLPSEYGPWGGTDLFTSLSSVFIDCIDCIWTVLEADRIYLFLCLVFLPSVYGPWGGTDLFTSLSSVLIDCIWTVLEAEQIYVFLCLVLHPTFHCCHVVTMYLVFAFLKQQLTGALSEAKYIRNTGIFSDFVFLLWPWIPKVFPNCVCLCAKFDDYRVNTLTSRLFTNKKKHMKT